MYPLEFANRHSFVIAVTRLSQATLANEVIKDHLEASVGLGEVIRGKGQTGTDAIYY